VVEARHARIAVQGASPERLEHALAEAVEAGALGAEQVEAPAPRLWLYTRLVDAERVRAAMLPLAGVTVGAAEALEPHRITTFLEGLARVVHLWYHKYRVIGEPEELPRLVLARAARQVLANGMALLGIHAPDRM